jgi:hypothetical protein
MPGILIENGLVQRFSFGGGSKVGQKARMAGKAADPGQKLDVLTLPTWRREEHEEDVHRVLVTGPVDNGGVRGGYQKQTLLQGRDDCVRNGHAIAKGGRMGLFPIPQPLKDFIPGRDESTAAQELADGLQYSKPVRGLQMVKDKLLT